MKLEFIKSAAGKEDFIQDSLPKLILTGRSNVGKSSLINAVSGSGNIARVSSTPGKTAFVNYYKADGKLYLVDLPGYGYAKVSQTERERWGELMEDFFASLDATARGLMIVDIRHKPTEGDIDMAECFLKLCIPFFAVANKSDKLKPSQIEPALALIKDTLGVEAIPFSAQKGIGKQELLKKMGI